MDSSFGSRLKEERQRLRLTQSKLGSIGGVAANAQAHYEKDLRFPKADYLMVIATVGVDPNYLLIGRRRNRETPSLNQVEQTLLLNYRSMSHLDQVAVSQISASVARAGRNAPAKSADMAKGHRSE
ncbi:helix-turn-helix transcriptional regulator [Pseudomonas sp. SIMBA_059]